MPTKLSQKETELVDSFKQILKDAHFPLEMRVRQFDWQRTTARPYGVEMTFLTPEPLGTKQKEVLLACAAQWREKHWPGKTVEHVDKLGIFITTHQPPSVTTTERFSKK